MPEKNKVLNDENISSYRQKQDFSTDYGIRTCNVDLSNKFDTVVMVFIGDWHIGSVDFNIDEAIKVLDYVLQTPNAKLIGIGDMMNTAILNSVSNMFEDVAYPQEQLNVLVSLLKQVANQEKVIWIHSGNHERRIDKNTGINPVEQATHALGIPNAYAPCFADTSITLKCPFCTSKKYTFNLVTHHGDSGNPENNATINQESLINAIGHKHVFQSSIKTKIIIDKNGKRVKKDELNIVLPAFGGGQYVFEKGLKPISKCPYYALEITTVKNPLFDKNNPYNMQPPVVAVTKSIPILSKGASTLKDECVKESSKIIDKHIKSIKPLVYGKMLEIVEILEKSGLEINREIKEKIVQIILEDSKATKKQNNNKLCPKKIAGRDWYYKE